MKLSMISELEVIPLYVDDETVEVKKVFCCDLLSIAMSKAPEKSAWVTVMGNRNALAVASLADVSCMVLAEGTTMDEACLKQAEKVGINIYKTELPVFDIALKIHEMI